MRLQPIGKAHVLEGELCLACGKELLKGTPDVFLMWEEREGTIHERCLRGVLAGESEVDGLEDHLVCTAVDEGEMLYMRLLAYSPEMGWSDWAICRCTLEGDEEIVESFSRVEYVEGVRG